MKLDGAWISKWAADVDGAEDALAGGVVFTHRAHRLDTSSVVPSVLRLNGLRFAGTGAQILAGTMVYRIAGHGPFEPRPSANTVTISLEAVRFPRPGLAWLKAPPRAPRSDRYDVDVRPLVPAE